MKIKQEENGQNANKKFYTTSSPEHAFHFLLDCPKLAVQRGKE